jgi:ferredoxin, 2Fe-2S
MPKIIFIAHDGQEFAVDGREGQSLMEVAVTNAVPGIMADCGGVCACATCHVYVEEPWKFGLNEPSEAERSMVEFASESRTTSRLSCQIKIKSDMEGFVAGLPKSQY